MSGALYSLPDPDDTPADEPQETPGEGAAAPAPPVSLVKTPRPRDTAYGGEAEDGDADETGAGEEPGQVRGLRSLIVPDLRPYLAVDAATARELGTLATDLTRSIAPRVWHAVLVTSRAISRGGLALARSVWRHLRTGTLVLGTIGYAWCTGDLAPKVKPVVRLLVAPCLVIYAGARTVARYPAAGLAAPVLWAGAALLAERWAVLYVARARTKKGGPTGLAARLSGTLDRAPAAPAKDALGAQPDEATPGSPEPGSDRADEATPAPAGSPPPPPSRDDITRALHALVGTSSGVLTTALRDYLGYPSTKAVRAALEQAGFPPPRGVRAEGANGPGIHRRDFPPLPSPREGHPDPALSQVNAANNNTNNTGEGSEEGLDAVGNDRGERAFDVVPDPERGPTAWKVVPRS